jgi:23S rRNA-/tRNA-specific pseudouridylate synthase
MMEQQLVLDFACSCCHEPVSVTVRCEGKGLALGSRVQASVHVPCPGCGTVHRLDFEPSGTLLAVRPSTAARGLAEPSLN